MKSTTAPAFINGLHIIDVTISRITPVAVKMTADYALAHAAKMEETGEESYATHGKCSAYPGNWSQRTNDLLLELLDSMEEDLLPRHFDTEPKEESDDEERAEHRREEGPAQV